MGFKHLCLTEIQQYFIDWLFSNGLPRDYNVLNCFEFLIKLLSEEADMLGFVHHLLCVIRKPNKKITVMTPMAAVT